MLRAITITGRVGSTLPSGMALSTGAVEAITYHNQGAFKSNIYLLTTVKIRNKKDDIVEAAEKGGMHLVIAPKIPISGEAMILTSSSIG